MKFIKTLKHWKLFSNFKFQISNSDHGGAIVMVLVFAGVFVIAVGSLLQFVLQQSVSGRGKVAREQSLQIAEAGLDYYKWYLAHNPNQDSETRTIEYKDPQSGARIGEFIISSTANKQCGDIMNRDIEVVGTADIDTRFTRTVGARYMKPSVANYSYVFNSGMWIGAPESAIGPVHSSQGIRIDGTHNSLITSGVSSWLCDYTYGCNTDTIKPGVWGAGSNPELWQYPKSEVNFSNITPDFSDLKSKAQSSGRYFASVSNGAGNKGYHIIFKSNGTFDMYRVDAAGFNWGWRGGDGVFKDYHTINSESFLGNYTVPSDCSLIYVEDQVWLEGVVNGKVALVVADTVHNYNPDVILHNNLTYANGPDVDGISVIAEESVLISAHSQEDLTVKGMFVAVNGMFGRHHYVENSGWYWDSSIGWEYMYGVGGAQDLNSIVVNGTSVSNERSTISWNYWVYRWGSGWLNQDSGFSNSSNIYERVQAFDPPPFTPNAEDVPRYVQWSEK